MKVRAVFWKELRENVRWAALALVAVSGLLAFGWNALFESNQGRDGAAEYSLLHAQLLSITLFCFPAVAIGLAFLQILPEQSHDRWAFLIHRPATRLQIFWGKVLAGLTLYSLAAGLPFGILCIWASLPGATPGPFYWGMIVPGCIDLLNGVALYFLALLSASRRAKWYGSKFVPLIAGVAIVGISSQVESPWSSLCWTFALLVLSPLAAAVAFLESGLSPRTKNGRQIPLALLLWIGFTTLLAFVAFPISQLSHRDWITDYRRYAVLDDGTIVLDTRQSNTEAILDLNQTPLASSTREMEDLRRRLLTETTIQTNKRRGHFTPESYRKPPSWLRPVASLYGSHWFYLPTEHYFVRHSKSDHRIEGYFGKAGFTTSVPRREDRFPSVKLGVHSSSFLYPFDRQVYWIDLLDDRIALLHEEEHEEQLRDAVVLRSHHDAPSESSLAAILTEPGRVLFLYQTNGKMVCRIKLPEFGNSYAGVGLLKRPDNTRFYVKLYPHPDFATEHPTLFLTYDEAGEQLAAAKLPPLHTTRRPHWKPPVHDYLPSGLGLWALGVVMESLTATSDGEDAASKWRQDMEEANRLRALCILTIIGVLSAGIASLWMRGRPHGRRTRILTIGCLFLTGLPGLLTLLCLRSWRRRIRCSACGSATSISLAHCLSCGSSWPLAANDGTEILTHSPLPAAAEPKKGS